MCMCINGCLSEQIPIIDSEQGLQTIEDDGKMPATKEHTGAENNQLHQ